MGDFGPREEYHTECSRMDIVNLFAKVVDRSIIIDTSLKNKLREFKKFDVYIIMTSFIPGLNSGCHFGSTTQTSLAK